MITTPSDTTSYLETSGLTSYSVSGDCNKDSEAITLTVTDSTGTDQSPVSPNNSTTCANNGKWSFDLGDISSYPDGNITFFVSLNDTGGTPPVVSDTVTVIKDTVGPSILTITDPPQPITHDVVGAYRLEGTCSEQGQGVAITLSNT